MIQLDDRHKSTDLAKSVLAVRGNSHREAGILAAARRGLIDHAGKGVTVTS
jgi:hypothetical protein